MGFGLSCSSFTSDGDFDFVQCWLLADCLIGNLDGFLELSMRAHQLATFSFWLFSCFSSFFSSSFCLFYSIFSLLQQLQSVIISFPLRRF